MADARSAGLPGISSFAKGLEQDLDAVTNGLTMPWSSGPVEGRVNHIKMVKRQMFGRAGSGVSAPAPGRACPGLAVGAESGAAGARRVGHCDHGR